MKNFLKLKKKQKQSNFKTKILKFAEKKQILNVLKKRQTNKKQLQKKYNLKLIQSIFSNSYNKRQCNNDNLIVI